MTSQKDIILTGAPGSGKTTIIEEMKRRGFECVTEAATDLIAALQRDGVSEPWLLPSFIAEIASLQRQRLETKSVVTSPFRFHDRSIFCTLALAQFQEVEPPREILEEARRFAETGHFCRDVFFVENIGFVEKTSARQISFNDAQRFGALHRQIYERYGYKLVSVANAELAQRCDQILRHIQNPEVQPRSASA